jgi:hypothetical protein
LPISAARKIAIQRALSEEMEDLWQKIQSCSGRKQAAGLKQSQKSDKVLGIKDKELEDTFSRL